MLTRPLEADVGIAAYIGPDVPGFTGRYKERWQDFHVNEVDLANVELHLSELITPGMVAAEQRQAAAERREARAALGPGYQPEPEVLQELEGALGTGPTSALVQFLQQQQPPGAPVEEEAGKEEKAPPFVDVDSASIGDGSKEARKVAHKALMKHFASTLNTETLEGDGGSRTIRIWMKDAERRVKSLPGAAAAAAPDEGGKGKGKGKGKDKGKDKGKKGKGKGKGGKGKDAAAATPEGTGEFGTLRREGWPKDRPDYLYFRLFKENINTGEAVASIAKCVGRSAKQFTYAGLKDKRAVTVQQICAHRLPADQLRRTLLHRMWDKRLRISDLEYRDTRLRLGMLKGNRFGIVLRRVPQAAVSSGTVDRAFAHVAERGFLNYYGLQRFGTREVGTHSVGAAVVAKRWDEAVRLILGDVPRKRPAEAAGEGERPAKAPRLDGGKAVEEVQPMDEGEAPAAPKEDVKEQRPKSQLIQEAQSIYLETGDAQKALDAMPRSQHLERCLLGALAKGAKPYEALQKLPHQSLSLYVHAAQSLVWNAVLSRRVRDFGSTAREGDLVLAAGADGAAADLDQDLDAYVEGQEAEDEGEEEAAPAAQLPEVRELANAEEAQGLGLGDLVLPLPGAGVRYPKYLVPAYEEAAKSLLGLSLQDFELSGLVPLSGAYRPMAVKPGDLQWTQAAVASNATILESDVRRLLDARPAEAEGDKEAEAKEEAVPAEEAPAAPEAVSGSEGEACVVFHCTLPPSAYLTMLLRELTKEDTGLLG